MKIVFPTNENRMGFAPLAPETRWAELSAPGGVALGAVTDEGEAASLLMAGLSGDTLELNWLYTAPEHRLLGYGGALFKALTDSAAQDGGISELEAFFPFLPDYDELYAFLIAMGAELTDISDAEIYETTIGALRESRLMGLQTAKTVALSDTPETYIKSYLIQTGERLPIDIAACLPCSRALIRDGKLRGLVLLAPRDDGNGATLRFCSAAKNDRAVLASLLGSMLPALCERYGDDAILTIATLDKTSGAVATALGISEGRLEIMRAGLSIGSR